MVIFSKHYHPAATPPSALAESAVRPTSSSTLILLGFCRSQLAFANDKVANNFCPITAFSLSLLRQELAVLKWSCSLPVFDAMRLDNGPKTFCLSAMISERFARNKFPIRRPSILITETLI